MPFCFYSFVIMLTFCNNSFDNFFPFRLEWGRGAFSFLLLFLPLLSMAQRNEIFSPSIASLQVVAGDDWMAPPVISLQGGEVLHIGFDDLTHDYHRYGYKLEHCEADWTPSTEVFASDYVDGIQDGNTIDDYEESLNTNQLYNHYSLDIPNDNCRPKLSGNYRLIIYDDNDNQRAVCKVCFSVVENSMAVILSGTTNTDEDINGRKQQVAMKLTYGRETVTSPDTQIKTVVLQNWRWDNAKINIRPQYHKADGLEWEHCRDFIFDGGNEYRKFEVLDLDHTTMGLEEIGWDGKRYVALPWTAEPRPSYVYDEDADGAFLVRNSDNEDVNSTCDYVCVHFRLKSPCLPGKVYLNGRWTQDQMLPCYEMEWNDTAQLYEKDVVLKQGYYNYQYLWMKSDGVTAFVPSEGNFFQTENRYQALVYFRSPSDRTDRLVGFVEMVLK